MRVKGWVSGLGLGLWSRSCFGKRVEVRSSFRTGVGLMFQDGGKGGFEVMGKGMF